MIGPLFSELDFGVFRAPLCGAKLQCRPSYREDIAVLRVADARRVLQHGSETLAQIAGELLMT